MKTEENKTQDIMFALLSGRTIDQWNDAREFRTTRLGGIVHKIRKKGLVVESIPVKGYERNPNPPVNYFCTDKSIQEYCEKKGIPVPEKKYKHFERVDDNKYLMK